jgi:hypothetical protein
MTTSLSKISRRNARAAVLFAVSFAALGLGFGWNAWDVADQHQFERQNRDMEAHVVARIVETHTEGWLSAGGLLGIGTLDGRPVDFEDWENLPVEEQFEAFREGRRFRLYEPYPSQIGAQGNAFALFDRITPGDPDDRLGRLHAVAAVLSAATLGLAVVWFDLEFGLFVALAVLGGTVASPWLTVFGGKLFWSLWAFYLPMLMTAFHLRGRPSVGRGALLRLGGVVCAGVLVKTLFSGFEYITTALVMTAVPVVYYALRHGWTGRETRRALLATAVGAGVAVAAAALVLMAQIGAVTGDPMAGWHHLVDAFERRTFPSRVRFPLEEGQSASVLDVLRLYFDAEWSAPGRFLPGATRLLPPAVRHVSFGGLLGAFAAASALVGLLGRSRPADRRLVDRALLAATWFSLLAPLSWFVIFKAHSSVHTHMAELIWHMPFVLFGFAVLGRACETAVQFSRHHVSRS